MAREAAAIRILLNRQDPRLDAGRAGGLKATDLAETPW
jgi:hypothetical protein